MKSQRLLFLSTVIFLLFGFSKNLPQNKIDNNIIIETKYKNEIIKCVNKEVIVKLKKTKNQAIALEQIKNLNFTIKQNFDELNWGCIEYNTQTYTLEEAINTILQIDNVEFAQPNYIEEECINPTNDTYYYNQWGLYNVGQSPSNGTSDADIDAENGWDISVGSANTIIAILDSGIPMLDGVLSHPDLDDPNRIILGPDYVNDGEGVRDLRGHGTHVAGICAAESNNSEGVAGVSWNSKILVIQVFNSSGNGSALTFYNGVKYASDYKTNNPQYQMVINYSGGGPASSLKEDAIMYANSRGITIVASVGNDNSSIIWPAAYSSSYTNVIAVGATDQNDNRSSYSNYGTQLNIVAPGGFGGSFDANDIYSTTPNYAFVLEANGVSRNYGYLAGTSMSAPFVTGLAALILSVNPTLTPSNIRNFIQQNAEDKGTAGFDNYYGYGRINSLRALANTFVQTNPQYSYNEGDMSLSLIQSDYWQGFQGSPAPGIAPGTYRCDRYEAIKTFNFYVETPQGWLLSPEGFSNANPNTCYPWYTRTTTDNSVEIKTFFYYIRYGVGGNVNQWVPFDPNPNNLRKASALGKPLVAPVIASMTQSPVPIYKGTYGYVYCNLSQGNGNLTYNWFSYDQPSYVSIVPEGYRCKIIYHNTESMPPIDAPTWNFGCTVSNAPGAGWSDTETFVPSLNSDPNGCPTLAFEQNGNLVSENPLLITSMSNPGKDVTDYYLINTPLTPVNNKLNLTIHEPQTEHTWFDNVSLLETRANPDETIVVNDEGQVINYKGVLPARILLNGETDITSNLLELDSLSVELNPGEKLTISRNAVEGDGDVVLGGEEPIIVKDRPSLIMNILTESKVEDSEEIKTESIPITNFFLRPNKSIISKRLRNLPTGTIEITVNKKLTLDYFVFVSDLRTARTRELPLVSAVHNVNGDVKTKLTGIDQNYAEMYPTERIDLSFSTTINSGNRAYILKTVGRYETDTTFVAKQNNLAKLNEQPIIPTENKLYDNYPNPFNPTTIIKYSLKDDGKVSLKIFNSLGEEVRTLVNEIKPAGNYEVEFNASELPSGIYIYSIQAGEYISSKKMILLK